MAADVPVPNTEQLDGALALVDYSFNSIWNGKPYATKQVRPIFVKESDRIVVVTVYVYYF